MTTYIRNMQHKFSLLDLPLVYNFSRLSNSEAAGLTKVFDGTPVQVEPVNVDKGVLWTQVDYLPYQALAADIQPFFKPLAYALILLRAEGYPCVFYGDVYGIKGDRPCPPPCGGKVPDLCLARKLYTYGEQHGITRLGSLV
ncbi:MAG: hypothetical protein LQ338_007780 [Usnochroma carphineum]|nr:MAG: hypothetical protein LQ338_007780 [Usnochroma carphineum]